VLHLGGRFVSKRLRQFITAARPQHLIVAGPDPSRIDPAHQVTQRIETDIEPFCMALRGEMEAQANSEWRATWKQAERRAAAALDAFADAEETLSEPLIARLVSQHIPPEQALVLASSMPVRDMQRYGAADGSTVPVFANRGASGIDGTVATAAGVAVARSAPVTLVIGDLALLHDLNSLQLLRQAPVIVVAINNDGGGIFHFLPIADVDDVFEPYFATPQGRSFESAAAMFDLPYAQPSSPDAFADVYASACASGASALIEVRTDRGENRDLHAELERRIADAVDSG
jgi:2-succinyl-5-enolpyruvyl-6-hydroxy-3-cyclohexene-1-carboxylate synthase